MTQQTQVQKQRTTTTETTEVEVPTEVNDQSADVSEDAACCLADIDEVLKDCEPKLTDEEILAAGHPNWSSEKYDVDHSLHGKEFDEAYDKAYAQFEEDEQRFHEAYERVHGVAYLHSGCGCSF